MPNGMQVITKCGEAIKRYELDMNFLEKSGEELLQESKNYES